MIRVDRNQRRVHIAGRRVHHGAVGVALIALGVTLAIHDRADWRVWF